MVGPTSARECDGERKLGMYSFRTIEGATCTVVVFSLLVGARRRSAVRGGAERSGETARPKDFKEQSELGALPLLMKCEKAPPPATPSLVAFHH